MSFPRSSGILLHPTSLPGPFGIGDLGPEAYKFVDFLVQAGQSLWQVLPLGPTGYGDSPYACYSAFAGNTLLISPEQLLVEGLLDHSSLRSLWPSASSVSNSISTQRTQRATENAEKIDFGEVHKHKDQIYFAELTSVTRRLRTPHCAAPSKRLPNNKRTGSRITRSFVR